METPPVPTDRPFTLHGAGCSRAVLRRLEMAGAVRRLVRGVYAAATLDLTPEVRHAALDLVLPDRSVPVGVTAAWAHGLLEECPRVLSDHRAPLSMLEAALTVGPTHGLIVYDAALRAGLPHRELLQAVPVWQRNLAALADGRSPSAAESRLRQAWLQADLPTPFLGHEVPGVGVRTALAHPRREFAATVEPVPARLLAECRSRGWWITEVDADRVTSVSLDLLAGHLRREFHRQLLSQIEVSPAG
ncbi:MAG: hypothetical protein EOO74_11825 [Myxococcales bacterium]|nr:MAG: hypothetical protein EOO74_11825 [Myxococcales bacterium]